MRCRKNLQNCSEVWKDTLLDEICSRLALKDQLNEVTVQDIRALRSHGIDTNEIGKAIRKTSGISEKKLKELFDDVIARNQKYYTSVIDMAGLTKPDILVNAATIEAIRAQTLDEFHNITQSMGFLVDKGRTMLRLRVHISGRWIPLLCRFRAEQSATIRRLSLRCNSLQAD